MRINFAHIRERATTGEPIDYAVFDARSNSGTDHDNAMVLSDLTAKARGAGYKVDQSALAFAEHGRVKFYGTDTLIDHLSRRGLPQWTHYIDV